MGEHPDQRQILVDQPDLIAPTVEEFLRYVSPVTHMCRTALDDVEVHGQQIKKGDYLCLLYPAANRDEDVWERAETLDVTRKPDPAHVAFGFAEHFCLGSNLARREAAHRDHRAPAALPQLRHRRRRRARPPAHGARHQEDVGRVPRSTLTGKGRDGVLKTPFR